MKPRTANEKEVARLAKRLPELTEAQRRWIDRNAVPAKALTYQKSTGLAWCTNCGQSFIDKPKVAKCPHCGAPITAHEYKPHNRVSNGRWYTTLVTTCGGWQVSRHFLVDHYCRRGSIHGNPAFEAVQIWTNEKGEEVINARAVRPMCGYYDAWNFQSELSIKRRGRYDYKYDICSHANRVISVLPVIRRNGYKGRFHGVSPDDFFKAVLTDNLAETLLKCRQYPLFRLVTEGRTPVNRDAVRVVIRHGYIVKDATMWRDYVTTLDDLGYDTHSPHYLCPKDLKAAHDRMLRLKERRDRQRELDRRQKEIKGAEKGYRARVGKYLGVVIVGKGITIRPLQSVREFFDEGAAMHHCVFANGYYKHKNTLILTARDKGGNRLETVEFDLTKGKVRQSRGVNNAHTPRHADIVSLCESNAMKLLKVKNKAATATP